MKYTHLVILLTLGGLLFVTQPAQAGPMLLIQHWDHKDVLANKLTLRTGARFDTTPLTGMGTEKVLLTQFNVISLLDNIAQNSDIAVFTDPPSLTQEGNIFALYIGGTFQYLSHVDNGGSAAIKLVNEVSGQDFGVRLFIANSQIILSGQEYNLKSSDFIDLPEPGSMLLLGSCLMGLGLVRRQLP